MAIVFALRGTSFNAVVSRSGKTARLYSEGAAPSIIADGTAIGGSLIDLAGATIAGISYAGLSNFSKNKAFSVLVRAKLNANLVSATPKGVFFMPAFGNFKIFRWFIESTGKTGFLYPKTVGNEFNDNAIGNANTQLANAYVDFVVCTSGLSGETIDFYVDGVLNGQLTWSADNIVTAEYWDSIQPCMNDGSGREVGKINEVVVWDHKIDPTAVLLEDTTTASLNGPARTSFVAATAFDGRLDVDPGVSNVREGVSYTLDGVNYLGTLEATSVTTGELTLEGGNRVLTLEGE